MRWVLVHEFPFMFLERKACVREAAFTPQKNTEIYPVTYVCAQETVWVETPSELRTVKKEEMI